jgi:hypothetical protein
LSANTSGAKPLEPRARRGPRPKARARCTDKREVLFGLGEPLRILISERGAAAPKEAPPIDAVAATLEAVGTSL